MSFSWRSFGGGENEDWPAEEHPDSVFLHELTCCDGGTVACLLLLPIANHGSVLVLRRMNAITFAGLCGPPRRSPCCC